MPGSRRLAVALFPALVLGSSACDQPGPARASLSAVEVLAGADTAGFARAERPRELRFPEDHGPHPDYRHEWWYFTGNLTGPGDREFGFQLTFFRSALRPGTLDHASGLASDWATNQVYMAHFAVTDVEGRRFHAFERLDRGAVGLAGARSDPFRVHVGEWVAEAHASPSASPALPAFRLRAAEGGVSIDLVLEPAKPMVFQGDDGLSQKGPEPGNASYYYSLTRLAARGTVGVGGEAIAAEGWAWLDREWGTSALGADLEGWDWFSIQLDDLTELMFFQLRRKDGSRDPLDSGSFVAADGSSTRLGVEDVRIETTGDWRSPAGHAYPSGWRLRAPDLDLDLRIEPALRDQEVDLSFRYWEGAVRVHGQREGRPVRGRGYVELTGYGEADTARSPSARGDPVTTSSSTGRPRTRSAR